MAKAFIPDIYVYTDGACSNNGKPNAKAGLGVFFGEGDSSTRVYYSSSSRRNYTASLYPRAYKSGIEEGVKMLFGMFKTKIDYKEKYEYEKARAEAAEKELFTLASELQETLNGFSIFRRGRKSEVLQKYNKK